MKKLFATLSILSVLFFFVPQAQAATLLTNIEGYWKLDGNSTDATGNGNNGTDTSITYSSSYGIINQGTLNTSSSNIDIADSASLQINTAITVCGWARVTTSGNYGTIFQKGQLYLLRTNGSTSQAEFYMRGLSSDLLSTTVLSLNTWYFICGVYDGSTMSIYINGTSDNSKAQTGSITTSTNAASIGWDSYDTGSNTHFLGDLDEIGVWSRALSGTEISQLYNSGTGLQYPFGVTTAPSPFALFSSIF